MEVKLIEANAFLQRLQKKKSGPANAKFTDGFNDAIMRVRSMVHSEPAVDLDYLPIVERLREDKERFRVMSETLAASNKDLIVVSKQAQEAAMEAKKAREDATKNARAAKAKCKSVQKRISKLEDDYGEVMRDLEYFLNKNTDDGVVHIPSYIVKVWIDEWKADLFEER